MVIHAWNFSQTSAHMWLGEQSFRCINPAHNSTIQTSKYRSLNTCLYHIRQIISLTVPLEQIFVSINIFPYRRDREREREREKQKARYQSHLITNDGIDQTHLYSTKKRPFLLFFEKAYNDKDLDQNIYRWWSQLIFSSNTRDNLFIKTKQLRTST